VAQTIPDAEALIVTTPQEISLADVRKSINFCRQVNLKILGVVENMSRLLCPHCAGEIDLFGSKGGELLAEKDHLSLLGKLPIEPEVVRNGDAGNASNLLRGQNPFASAFGSFVDQVLHLTVPSVSPSTVSSAGERGHDETLQQSQGFPPGDESKKKEDDLEKTIFAVPVSGGKLCSHFGHCDQFALIATEQGMIKDTTMHTPPPHEPGLLPRWLHGMGANIIIAGGMGARAQQLFKENGISVVTGAPMDAPEVLVNQYLTETLVTGANVCDH
jgi:predicted Fe-Mo cluster-binding NifX family protein